MRHIIAVIGLILFPTLTWAAAGQVESANGKVWDIRGQQTLPLTSGSIVDTSDVIWSGKSGQVRLVMSDDSVVVLGPNSRIRIDRYDTDQQGLVSGTFYLLWGKARFLAAQSNPSSSHFSVMTQTATISTQDGEFGVIVSSPDLNDRQLPTTDALSFKGMIVGKGFTGNSIAMEPGEVTHFTVEQAPEERAMVIGDKQRLDIGSLAPGLIEPEPIQNRANSNIQVNIQTQTPGNIGRPGFLQPSQMGFSVPHPNIPHPNIPHPNIPHPNIPHPHP